MTPQEAESLKAQIAEVVQNAIETTAKETLVYGAYLLSNKYGLNKEQIASWMQETLEAVMSELKAKGLQ